MSLNDLYNPNRTITSFTRAHSSMQEIKRQFNRTASELIEVSTKTYKFGDSHGAVFRFDHKDDDGISTGKQYSFWTTPVEVAFEDFRGNHHPSCTNYPCEGPITDSKRKLSWNMGYMSDGMQSLLDREHGPGTATQMMEEQKKMHDTIEENLAHILGEIHRLGQSKEVADEMKREGVADGVVPTIIKECKKKANKDKNIFLSQCKGASWEANDSGITTVFSNWTRTFAGGRNDKRIVYPNVLDKSGDLTTDITPDGSAYTFHGDTNTWTYDAQKDPHVVKRGQLVKLLLTPQFYCTKSGAKGMRFKIQKVKLLKASPYGEKRGAADLDWGDSELDNLDNYAKRARTDE